VCHVSDGGGRCTATPDEYRDNGESKRYRTGDAHMTRPAASKVLLVGPWLASHRPVGG
jgi:hypothetical protein